MSEHIVFDRVTFGLFLIEYVHAEMEGAESFSFQGHDFDVKYARYLATQLMKQFKGTHNA